jgi:thymidylate synthase ThyX
VSDEPTSKVEENAVRIAREQDISYAEALRVVTELPEHFPEHEGEEQACADKPTKTVVLCEHDPCLTDPLCPNYIGLKTPEEWSLLDGVTVADPDGWRDHFRTVDADYAPKDWRDPITRKEWDDRLSVSSVIRRPEPTKAVQKWADTAMFSSEKLDATTGPKVHLLSANPDPLGSIAAMALMYKGIVVRDLADVTDDQRREMFAQIQQTKLKAPFEAVQLHWMVEGVTRSFTHQMVRQRTAVFAQESLRFAVVEDGFTTRTAPPPSLAGTEVAWEEGVSPENIIWEQDSLRDLMTMSPEQRWRYRWDRALAVLEWAYGHNVADGQPAEDARGLLPHNVTTRLNYVTNLRNFQEHGGARLCTQAQFEWRAVWIAFVQELRRYGQEQVYRTREAGDTVIAKWDVREDGGVENKQYMRPGVRSSAWQFDLLADMFRPACYLTGKCEFAAMDLDRKCSIRDRVDANAKAGRPSAFWHTHGNGNLKPIDPMEWLGNPEAAR